MVTKKKAVTEEPLKINPIPPLQEIIQGISRITNTSASGSLNYNEDDLVIAQDGNKLRKEKKKSEIVTAKKMVIQLYLIILKLILMLMNKNCKVNGNK